MSGGCELLEARAGLCRLVLQVFIAICGVSALLLLVLLAGQLQVADISTAWRDLVSTAEAAFWLVLLAGAVPIALWIYRAHANLRDAWLDGLRHSPAWAVGSFFVPVANLWVPYAAMRELVNRSEGRPAAAASAGARETTVWWLCHIAAVVLASAAVVIALLPLLGDPLGSIPPATISLLGLATLCLWTGSAYFLLRLIARITAAQCNGPGSAAAAC